MRLADTNILIRYLTRDDEKKATRALELLKRVEGNEERIILSQMVVFETIFVLEAYYGVGRTDIAEKVGAILNLRGVTVEHKNTFLSALELYAVSSKLSFADAFNACFMRDRGIEEIYSWDTDFDRVDWVGRVEP